MSEADVGPAPAEEARIRKILDKWRFPRNVRGYELDFDVDSSGDPAVYIVFTVDDAMNPSDQTVRNVTDFSQELRNQLLRAGVRHWPYFRFQAPA
jgi:hypothetical protein